jgi:hypothetical protein
LNNFATGLVRRSAGLPLPAAVRPAPGTANISPAAEPSEPPTAELMHQEKASPFASSPAEPAVPSTPGPTSTPAVFCQTRRIVDDPPANRQEQIPLQPRMDPFPPSIEEEGRQPARITQSELPSPVSARISPPSPLPEAASAAIAPKAAAEPDARPAPVQPPEPLTTALELSPKPEPRTAPEAAAPVKTEDAPTSRETSPDVRNIHVKIGKIELRTPQPMSVAPQPRSSRTSGFDDLRLTRIYLDRGAR